MSVRWYVGVPQSGKTTLALHHAAELQQRDGWPVLILDAEGAKNLSPYPLAPNLDSAINAVVGNGQTVRYEPRTPDHAAAAARAVHRAGRVILVIDGAHAWLTAHRQTEAFVRLMRSHAHAPAHVLATTHHLSGDVPQSVLSCAPELYVFKCISRPVLKLLSEEYGYDPAQVRNLEVGQFIRFSPGFA